MRVLLIEDDSAIAQSIELMLKSESFNVYTTDLGEEGVDLGKLYDYDIILLDLNLPDMSGYEVLRSLRVAKVKTPILILSGLAGIEDKVEGLGFGADDYLTKPFHKDELVARIHAIVRRSKGHAQSVITTGDLVVNLDQKTVEVAGARVHLTGKEYQMLELLSPAQGHDADQGNVSEPSLWRHGRAGTQDHRRVHLQAAQKTRQRQPGQELHRDRLGPRLCAARADRLRRAHRGLSAPRQLRSAKSPASAGLFRFSRPPVRSGRTVASCDKHGQGRPSEQGILEKSWKIPRPPQGGAAQTRPMSWNLAVTLSRSNGLSM